MWSPLEEMGSLVDSPAKAHLGINPWQSPGNSWTISPTWSRRYLEVTLSNAWYTCSMVSDCLNVILTFSDNCSENLSAIACTWSHRRTWASYWTPPMRFQLNSSVPSLNNWRQRWQTTGLVLAVVSRQVQHLVVWWVEVVWTVEICGSIFLVNFRVFLSFAVNWLSIFPVQRQMILQTGMTYYSYLFIIHSRSFSPKVLNWQSCTNIWC